MRITHLVWLLLVIMACDDNEKNQHISQAEMNFQSYMDYKIEQRKREFLRLKLHRAILQRKSEVTGDAFVDSLNIVTCCQIEERLIEWDKHNDSIKFIAGEIMELLYGSGTMMPMMTNDIMKDLAYSDSTALRKILLEIEN